MTSDAQRPVDMPSSPPPPRRVDVGARRDRPTRSPDRSRDDVDDRETRRAEADPLAPFVDGLIFRPRTGAQSKTEPERRRVDAGEPPQPDAGTNVDVRRSHAVLVAMLDACCRPGDVLSLRWRDVDFTLGELSIPGSASPAGRVRRAPLTPRLLGVLEARRLELLADGRLEPDGLLFADHASDERSASVRFWSHVDEAGAERRASQPRRRAADRRTGSPIAHHPSPMIAGPAQLGAPGVIDPPAARLCPVHGALRAIRRPYPGDGMTPFGPP